MSKHMLIPLDGSIYSESAINEALDLAYDDTQATLLIAAEVPEPYAERPVGGYDSWAWLFMRDSIGIEVKHPARHLETKDQAVAWVKDELEMYLQEKGRPFLEHGVDVRYAVEFASPVAAITDYAKENDVGLIVMATHGRTGLKEIVFGSITEAVVRSGVAPVVVVRPKELREGMAANTTTGAQRGAVSEGGTTQGESNAGI
jgi:nucleotide-binding universal stress UspA family protein